MNLTLGCDHLIVLKVKVKTKSKRAKATQRYFYEEEKGLSLNYDNYNLLLHCVWGWWIFISIWGDISSTKYLELELSQSYRR